MNGKQTIWLRPSARCGRALRCVLAVWFAVLNLGVSMPSPPAEKASSQPFPCQDHRCGCRDADHCWRSCCCMTREQKFAWALEHGVTPPASFFAEQNKPPAKMASCCAKRHGKIASTASSPRSAGRKAGSAKSSGAKSGGQVALLDALRCRGESMSWTVVLPPSLRPDAIFRELLADVASSPLTGEPALIFSAPTFDPPVPPPRCG